MQNSDISGHQVQTNEASVESQPHLDIVVSEPGELIPQNQTGEIIKQIPRRFPHLQSVVMLWLGLGGLMAIALVILGWNRWLYVRNFAETNDAYVATDITGVNVRVPGTVSKVSIPPNFQVKKGSLLVQLNSEPYEAKLKQALANFQLAQADVKASQQTLQATQKPIKQPNQATSTTQLWDRNLTNSRDRVNTIRVQLNKIDPNFLRTQLDYNRFHQLHQQGLISLKTLTQTKDYHERVKILRDKLLEKWQQAQTDLVKVQVDLLDRQIETINQKIAKLPPLEPESSQPNSYSFPNQNPRIKALTENFQAQIEKLAEKKELANRTPQINQEIYEYEFKQQRIKVAKNITNQLYTHLRAARYQLASTKITAPSNGKIGQTQVEVGQQVKPGQTLMSLIKEPRWVTANFSQEQLQEIKPGQPVQIKIENLGDRTLSGTVKTTPNTNPKKSPSTKKKNNQNPHKNQTKKTTSNLNFPVKIVFDKTNLEIEKTKLIPGTNATVKVKVRE